MTTKANKELIEKLSQSQMYRNCERAFTETTGMPVSLCPVLVVREKEHEFV
ncbi:MAG: hypothetical protein ACKVJX_11930 [Verrucomicrobiia bacterium]|jgi:hypothetical protein